LDPYINNLKQTLKPKGISDEVWLLRKLDDTLKTSNPVLWSKKQIADHYMHSEFHKPVFNYYTKTGKAGLKVHDVLRYVIPAIIGVSGLSYVIYQGIKASKQRKARRKQKGNVEKAAASTRYFKRKVTKEEKKDYDELKKMLIASTATAAGVGGSYWAGQKIISDKDVNTLKQFSNDILNWQRGHINPKEMLNQYLEGATSSLQTKALGKPSHKWLTHFKDMMTRTSELAESEKVKKLTGKSNYLDNKRQDISRLAKKFSPGDAWYYRHYKAFERGPIAAYQHYLIDRPLTGDPTHFRFNDPSVYPMQPLKSEEVLGKPLHKQYKDYSASLQRNINELVGQKNLTLPENFSYSEIPGRLNNEIGQVKQQFYPDKAKLSIPEEISILNKVDAKLKIEDPLFWIKKQISDYQIQGEFYKPAYKLYSKGAKVGLNIINALKYGVPIGIGVAGISYIMYQLIKAIRRNKKTIKKYEKIKIIEGQKKEGQAKRKKNELKEEVIDMAHGARRGARIGSTVGVIPGAILGGILATLYGNKLVPKTFDYNPSNPSQRLNALLAGVLVGGGVGGLAGGLYGGTRGAIIQPILDPPLNTKEKRSPLYSSYVGAKKGLIPGALMGGLTGLGYSTLLHSGSDLPSRLKFALMESLAGIGIGGTTGAITGAMIRPFKVKT
ncbi:hypothetical protein ACFLQL_04050, partial [Verrucomicrobiota bacterium]